MGVADYIKVFCPDQGEGLMHVCESITVSLQDGSQPTYNEHISQSNLLKELVTVSVAFQGPFLLLLWSTPPSWFHFSILCVWCVCGVCVCVCVCVCGVCVCVCGVCMCVCVCVCVWCVCMCGVCVCVCVCIFMFTSVFVLQGEIIQGIIRVNKFRYKDEAFVTAFNQPPGLEGDILVQGLTNR